VVATQIELADAVFRLILMRDMHPDDLSDLVQPGDWPTPGHARIWSAIERVASAGCEPADTMRLRGEGGLDDEHVQTFLAAYGRGAIPASRLREEWVAARKHRRARAALERAADQVRAGGDDPVTLAKSLQTEIDAILRDDDLRVDDLDAHADAAIALRRDVDVGGLEFPWPGWTHRFGRLRPGNLYSTFGSTGAGKTTLTANIVAHWVQALREPVAMFSTETTGGEVLRLLACIHGGLEMEGAGGTGDYDREINTHWRPLKAEGRFIVNAYARPTAAMVLAGLRRYRARGIRTFVIDHAHQVALPDGREGWEALERFTGELHAFAQNTDSTLWVVWQPRKAQAGEPQNKDGHLGIDSIKGGQLIAALSARVFNPFQTPVKLLDDEAAMEDRRAAMSRDVPFLVACLKDRDHGPQKAVQLHLDPATKRLRDKAGAPFAPAEVAR
jgi:hypothetical protein